jgi:hypothetical protein
MADRTQIINTATAPDGTKLVRKSENNAYAYALIRLIEVKKFVGRTLIGECIYEDTGRKAWKLIAMSRTHSGAMRASRYSSDVGYTVVPVETTIRIIKSRKA